MVASVKTQGSSGRKMFRAKGAGGKTQYANVDKPQPSGLVGKVGHKHEGQTQGHSIGWSYTPGRGVGGAPHHQGSTFGGKTDCIRGATKPALPGGQVIK